MRSKIASGMKPISIRTFLKTVGGKSTRAQFHFYGDLKSNKNFSIADISVDRIERDCDRLTFLFNGNWMLVHIRSENVLRFYNGDMLYYCIDAEGVEVIVNIL